MDESLPNVVVSASRAELDGDTVGAVDLRDSLEDLESEARAVLGTTTPCIRAGVGGAVQELVDKVAIGAVDLGYR